MSAPASASRTRNSTRNAAAGVICQALTMLLAFLVRMVFVRTLSEDYLGISGWFSGILSILSISELGIGTAVVVSLYQPLAEGNEPQIRATLRLLRRAYFYVGFAMLALGLALLPFLPSLVKEHTALVNLQVVYVLYLSQSVFSYLFGGYKAAIFTANQQQSRIHFWGLCASVLTAIAQTAALYIWHNYYAYVTVFALSSVLKNLLIAKSANRTYAYVRDVARQRPDEDDEQYLPREKRRDIFRNLFGLSLYRVSGTVLNVTDTLVLGGFIGFGVIGLHSNYLLAVTAVTTVLTLLFQSLTASVGNLNVTGTPEHKHFIFRCLNLLDGWLYGVSAVCLFVLLDPFVEIFFGKEWVFTDARIVPVIALNFLTSGLLENVIMHKDACGLFWQGRFRPIFSAGLNIALSIWWVGPLGLFGVLLATVVSRLLTTWWFDPWMVHHYALKASVRGYVKQTLLVLAAAALCGAGLKVLAQWWFPQVTVFGFAVMILCCAVIPNVLFYGLFSRRKEFTYLKEKLLEQAKKR